MLGNRRPTYRLLFHAAWEALGEVLREELGCEPAALMVLHTWNQRLEHYPHLHALVPGGGPSQDGQQWVRSKLRRVRDEDKPYLVDNRVLSARFRDKFLAGLKRLHRDGKLKLTDRWSSLQDPAAFRDWLQPLSDCDWVVFIEPPPTQDANPEHVLKYLARYLTGGPISDRRLIDHQDGKITFWARGHDKESGHQREPYTLSGAEFTRRWALHILPKGFIKSRCFGGFSCRHRKTYLDRCRTLLDLKRADPATAEGAAESAEPSPPAPRCPRCQTSMTCVSQGERVSWRKVLRGRHCPRGTTPLTMPSAGAAATGIANRPTDNTCTGTTARPCLLLPRATANARQSQGLLAHCKNRFFRPPIGSLPTSSGPFCRVAPSCFEPFRAATLVT
jgi:hypothetical protein